LQVVQAVLVVCTGLAIGYGRVGALSGTARANGTGVTIVTVCIDLTTGASLNRDELTGLGFRVTRVRCARVVIVTHNDFLRAFLRKAA